MQSLLALDRTEVGLEHHVELSRLGPLATFAAVGADDVTHRHRLRIRQTLFLRVRLLHVVLAVALMAFQAFDERVVEHLDVTGGHPHLTRKDDRGVQADDVIASGNHRPPPLALDVLLQFDTQWPVVPRRAGTAVDLAGGIHQAAALCQIDHGIDDRRHDGLHSCLLKCLLKANQISLGD